MLEVGETLTVTLTDADTTGTVALGAQREATTTIGYSEGAVIVTVDDAAAAEGSPALYEVSLSGAVSTDVVVDYATANGTATTADYEAQSRGTVTIYADDSDRKTTITVDTRDDMLSEDEERFTVRLSLPGEPPHLSLMNSTATATIAASDPLDVELEGPENRSRGQDGDLHGEADGWHRQRGCRGRL